MKLKYALGALFILLLLLPTTLSAKSSLIKLLETNDWQTLGELTSDQTHLVIEEYFKTVKSIKAAPMEGSRLVYKAKFQKEGETGVLSYQMDGDKFSKFELKNQIRPLFFVEHFIRYPVKNIKFKVGEAEVHLIDGTLYQSSPFDILLVFEGKWTFQITPSDDEEVLTLRNLYRRNQFVKQNKSGIFIMEDKGFIKKLTPYGQLSRLGKSLRKIMGSFQQRYGVDIKQFNEFWYLPFLRNTNLVVFEQTRKSFYYYSYSDDSVPDTRLSNSEGKIILSYNARSGLRFKFGVADMVKKISLNLFYNPSNNFISGSSTIHYKYPSGLRTVYLQRGLSIRGNLNEELKDLNIFRQDNKIYLVSPDTRKHSLFYGGHVEPQFYNWDRFNKQVIERDGYSLYLGLSKKKRYFYMSRDQNFYPNPGPEFIQAELTLNLPKEFECLAVGNLKEKVNLSNRNLFRYSSKGVKGIAFVCGLFDFRETLEASLPLNLYASPNSVYPRYIDKKELAEGWEYFIQLYGKPDYKALNILFSEHIDEGGISNKGFVIINLNTRNFAKGVKYIGSPLSLRSNKNDYLFHEMAHQWWGGMLSWKSYRDVWITEGLAHFSVIYFLKQRLSPRKFDSLLRRLKRSVARHSDEGPIIYGNRIHSLTGDYEAYQSVVYNKSALAFLMLVDWLGEEEFFSRLGEVLKTFRFMSISSSQFVEKFSDNHPQLRDFFKGWFFSRKIPDVDVETQILPLNKQLKVRIQQKGTPLIFPLPIAIQTPTGIHRKVVIVSQQEQVELVRSDEGPIVDVQLPESAVPIRY